MAKELIALYESMQIDMLSQGRADLALADSPKLLLRWGKIALINLRKSNAYLRDIGLAKTGDKASHWTSVKDNALEILSSVIEGLPIQMDMLEEPNPWLHAAIGEFAGQVAQALYEESAIDAALSEESAKDLLSAEDLDQILAIANLA